MIASNSYTEFINENFGLKSSNFKLRNQKAIIKIGNYQTFFYSNTVHNGNKKFTTEGCKKRFGNCYIKIKDSIGTIKLIIKHEEIVFILCQKLLIIDNPFYCLREKTEKANMYINSTTKIFLLNVIENYQSVTEPSTNIKSHQKDNFNSQDQS
ncbi:hypothetical protein BpHYR1_010462 [Brachionus plicatilis]|uniref:Uncharacterized protein n=1 Tax=Brachionus plicatilis TaxID=10195 RepID=A0A3M7SLL8_BRAPC|nr:hypothetical protein BpHYR1_010462 [Brachionus plicatilis]